MEPGSYDRTMLADPRVDQYIAAAPAFAQPILTYLRQLVHEGCPEVEETIKWSRPIFVSRNKLLFGMAAFKAHCGRFLDSGSEKTSCEEGLQVEPGFASPSAFQNQGIQWITEANRDETRQKRIATALEWLAEGKPRNWKYQNC